VFIQTSVFNIVCIKRALPIFLFCLSILFNTAAQSYIKYPNNPVIDTLSTTNLNEFWTRWKTDPHVIHWGNDSLRMYYGTNNYGVQNQIEKLSCHLIFIKLILQF